MRQAFTTIFALLNALFAAATPLTETVENISAGLAAGSRVFRKSIENFETELDIEAKAKAKELDGTTA